MPSYDSYQELARIRAATNANLAFNAIQTGLLADLSGTMQAIDGEIAAVRQTQNEALAVQQQLLQQEVIQSQLEEFIFQAEKLAEQCSQPDCELPPSTRYFLLKGVSEHVRQNGIGTPIIRGRDNKAAFERVLESVGTLTSKLKSEPEVAEAIAWAKEEQERAKAAKKKLDAKQKKAQAERQKKIQQLEVRYSTLQARTTAPPVMNLDDFKDWYSRTITPPIEKYSGPVPDMAVHAVLWLWGSMLYPLAYFRSKFSQQNAQHAPLMAEMRQIEDELNKLLADESIEGPVTGITQTSGGGA